MWDGQIRLYNIHTQKIYAGLKEYVLKFAQVIKEKYPKIKIAIGGIHPTSYYKEILTNCSEIDYVAIGEGETSLLKLIKCLENKILKYKGKK